MAKASKAKGNKEWNVPEEPFSKVLPQLSGNSELQAISNAILSQILNTDISVHMSSPLNYQGTVRRARITALWLLHAANRLENENCEHPQIIGRVDDMFAILLSARDRPQQIRHVLTLLISLYSVLRIPEIINSLKPANQDEATRHDEVLGAFRNSDDTIIMIMTILFPETVCRWDDNSLRESLNEAINAWRLDRNKWKRLDDLFDALKLDAGKKQVNRRENHRRTWLIWRKTMGLPQIEQMMLRDPNLGEKLTPFWNLMSEYAVACGLVSMTSDKFRGAWERLPSNVQPT